MYSMFLSAYSHITVCYMMFKSNMLNWGFKVKH